MMQRIKKNLKVHVCSGVEQGRAYLIISLFAGHGERGASVFIGGIHVRLLFEQLGDNIRGVLLRGNEQRRPAVLRILESDPSRS